MGTPHNGANNGDIAKVVLMPGDPLRAKYIADNYLEDVVQFNEVRNMFGYTGMYKGKRISVMGSGMGMPSIGIYSHELYNSYDVEAIIRIGSAGGISDATGLRDIVLAQGACTSSSYQDQYRLAGHFAPIADFDMLLTAKNKADELISKRAAESGASDIKVLVGNLLSTDVFYNADETFNDRWKAMGVLAVEMEAAALYMNAAYAGKRALCIATISDHLYRPESLTAIERQVGFNDMMVIALETAAEYV